MSESKQKLNLWFLYPNLMGAAHGRKLKILFFFRLIMTGFGNSLEEITKELDDCENVMNALAVDGNKARNLLRAGKELMLEHPFTRESLGNVSK